MKHIRLIKTETEFEGVKGTLETPWVVLTEDDMKVHMPLVEVGNCIICKLTTTEPNQVCGIGDVYLEKDNEAEGLKYGFSKVVIDGVELNLDDYSDGNNYNEDEGYFEYTFAEVGEHTLKYYLLDETEIKDYSFFGPSIESAIIPSSVTSIDDGVFQHCSSLTNITIPNSVTSIGYDVFDDCTSLTTITYNGAVEQWNAITKEARWHRDVPSTTVVTCTDGTVTLNGILILQYEYVDLGLPSGKKWAKCNLGATTETEYGDYYMWGSVTPDTNNTCDWSHAPFNNGSSDFDETYFASVRGTVCPNDVLSEEYDIVYQATIGEAHMPTEDDIQELIDNTNSEWVTDYQGSGVNGRLFTSKTNDNSIFVPYAGFRWDDSFNHEGRDANLWSSSFDGVSLHNAWCLHFDKDEVFLDDYDRFSGFSVRGVKD